MVQSAVRSIGSLLVLGIVICSVIADDDAEKKAEKKPVARAVRVQVLAPGFAIGGRVANPVFLLRNSNVQKELKLDEEQNKQIKQSFADQTQARRNMFTAIRELPQEERATKRLEMRAKVQKVTEESNRKIMKILKPEQSKRLDQISLQQRGIRALTDKKITAKLKITDEQSVKIATAIKKGMDDRRQLGQDLRIGIIPRENYSTDLKLTQEKADANTIKVLTKEQRKQFADMKGKKFELRAGVQLLRAVPLRIEIGPGKAIPFRIEIRPGKPVPVPKKERKP